MVGGVAQANKVCNLYGVIVFPLLLPHQFNQNLSPLKAWGESSIADLRDSPCKKIVHNFRCFMGNLVSSFSCPRFLSAKKGKNAVMLLKGISCYLFISPHLYPVSHFRPKQCKRLTQQ